MLEEGVVVGRIFKAQVAPEGRPWMWASGHNGDIRHAALGYEPTRGRRWRRSLRAGAALGRLTNCPALQDRCRHIEAERLAVVILSTVSYFTDNCTGRSAGFSLLRMRST